MRVLTFLHSFEPGGVERVALRLVRQWREQGVDAPLFMGRRDGAMQRELGEELDADMPPRARFSIAWCETLWMIAMLPAAIRRWRPDVLFCAGNSYAVVAVAMKLLLGGRCPPVVAKISNDLERRDMPWAGRFFYRLWLRVQGHFIDHFVAMAPGLEAEIATLARPRRPGIGIIPDPALSSAQIDRLRARTLSGTAGEGRRFAAIGRLVRQKNFALMLEAFALGAGVRDRLTLYGDGPDRERLKKLADWLGIGERVDFAGHVTDPLSRIGRGDIVLLSSDYEGVPAVILEALAAGQPIIATECSAAMRALLLDGALGRLVPVGDVTAFACAIADAERIVQDEAASLAQARHFTLEAAAPSYLTRFAATARLGSSGEKSCPEQLRRPLGGNVTSSSQ
ncbi:glycosyltransferase [Sphingobium estronivorans]|uniref:glycosyltransferase n=1 Tax=Sphingobium estronivorans TaxID=1577690 RepID=UPI00123B3EA0|nr:glycosyltransferase [Sphingobium estronivorans]